MSQPEAFDIDRIITETFVREVRYFDTIRSTNDVALESCGDQELATPWLVVAAEQTAGRGRGSNRWWSARGSLTFSVVIAPAALGLHERDWPTMSLTTGLAVCLAIGRLATDQQTALKWPNDVYLQNKKVSGVLLEVGPRTAGRLVLGVGINVNNSFDGAPEELSAATSLIDVTGVEIQLTRVLIDVLCELEDQLKRLARHDPELAVDWQNACMLRGRSIEVEAGSTRESGRCQGIDKDGALLFVDRPRNPPAIQWNRPSRLTAGSPLVLLFFSCSCSCSCSGTATPVNSAWPGLKRGYGSPRMAGQHSTSRSRKQSREL